jgi:hypothetical protein
MSYSSWNYKPDPGARLKDTSLSPGLFFLPGERLDYKGIMDFS